MDCTKRKWSRGLRWLLLSAMLGGPAWAADEREIRVGIYDNRSLLFLDEQSRPSGFFPEILQAVAAASGWRLNYQSCVWAECLRMLEAGHIDLLPSIAFSEARAQRYRFNKESLLLNWGVVYHASDDGIEQIFDLEGQRVGVLREDIYHAGFRDLTRAFEVTVEWVEFDSFVAIRDALNEQRIDAGVVNRVFEALDPGVLSLNRTPIIFSPVELHFAAAPSWPLADETLARIDRQLIEMKASPGSVYHQAVHRWYGDLPGLQVPPWLRKAFLAALALLVLAAVVMAWLRYEVARRTRELQLSQQRYRQLYEGSPTILFKLDRERRVQSINEFGAKSLGYQSEDLLGRPAAELLVPESRYAIAQFIAANPNPSEDDLRRFDVRVQRRDGSDFPVRLIGRWQRDPELGMTLTMVGEDSSDNARLTEELAFRVAHDPLTGLPNRREFMGRMSRALEDEEGPQHALLYVDLDGFRLINDSYGHALGDRVLVEVAQILRKFVKRADLVARLGGDEFGLLVLNCDQDCARAVAERLVAALQEQLSVKPDAGFKLRACVGVSFWQSGQSLSESLARAEAAVVQAKREGANRIRICCDGDEDFAAVSSEATWVHRINRAMAEGHLELFAQAIQPLVDDALPGERFELLLRLRDERGQIVAPGRFLPSLERHRQIVDVDRWVVSTAFQWLAQQAPENLMLATINLSGLTLADPGFEGHVLEQARHWQVPTYKVCFEITETAAIENLAAASSLMERLRQQGFVFALDDFGAGVSSFAYMRNLPVRYVKLDGQFVRDAVRNPIDRALIRAVREVAGIMGIETIAEFAENTETIELLRSLDIDYAQGYAIGMPKPLSDL